VVMVDNFNRRQDSNMKILTTTRKESASFCIMAGPVTEL